MGYAEDHKSCKGELVFEPVWPVDKPLWLGSSVLTVFAIVFDTAWFESVRSLVSLTVWSLTIFVMAYMVFYFRALAYGIRKIRIDKDNIYINFIFTENVHSRSSVRFEKSDIFYKYIYVYVNGSRMYSIDSRFDIDGIWSALRTEDKHKEGQNQ